MCMPDSPPEAPPPPPPPAPPKPIDFGSESTRTGAKKRSTNARKSLSIPLSVGGTESGSGLNVPS